MELLRDKYETKVDRLETKIDKLEARAERDLEKIDSLQFRLDAERERVMELSSLAQDYSKVGKRNIEEQEKLEVLTRTVREYQEILAEKQSEIDELNYLKLENRELKEQANLSTICETCDSLKAQMVEKDRLVEQLQQQVASTPTSPKPWGR